MKKLLFKYMRRVHRVLFKNRIENKRLKKENDTLAFQVSYLKRHFDIGQMKPANGYLREFQLVEVDFTRHILDLLKPYGIREMVQTGTVAIDKGKAGIRV